MGKPETQTLVGGRGVSNLTFFYTMHIYEIAAIVLIFHNCQHQYSISINTQKTRDPTGGGGVSNLICFCTTYINKMVAIFQFFHNGRHRYSISVDTRKTRDPNFVGGGVSNLNFFCMIHIYKMVYWPFPLLPLPPLLHPSHFCNIKVDCYKIISHFTDWKYTLHKLKIHKGFWRFHFGIHTSPSAPPPFS